MGDYARDVLRSAPAVYHDDATTVRAAMGGSAITWIDSNPRPAPCCCCTYALIAEVDAARSERFANARGNDLEIYIVPRSARALSMIPSTTDDLASA